MITDPTRIGKIIDARHLVPEPACHVFETANQTGVANNTDTPVLFSIEQVDIGNMHSTTTNTDRITFKVAGIYDVSGHITWDANAAGTTRELRLLLNGASNLDVDDRAPTAAFGLTLHVGVVGYKFLVGDYVDLIAFQDSGGDRIIQNASVAARFGAAWQGNVT